MQKHLYQGIIEFEPLLIRTLHDFISVNSVFIGLKELGSLNTQHSTAKVK